VSIPRRTNFYRLLTTCPARSLIRGFRVVRNRFTCPNAFRLLSSSFSISPPTVPFFLLSFSGAVRPTPHSLLSGADVCPVDTAGAFYFECFPQVPGTRVRVDAPAAPMPPSQFLFWRRIAQAFSRSPPLVFTDLKSVFATPVTETLVHRLRIVPG